MLWDNLLFRFVAQYEGPEMTESLPDLADGQKEHVWISHDESAFHANDYKQDYYLKEGEQVLKKKEKGRLIMVSRFITPRYGVLRLTEEMEAANKLLPDQERLTVTDSSIMIFPTSKATGDSYWDAEQMEEQVHKHSKQTSTY
jgi:hypothetical protein